MSFFRPALAAALIITPFAAAPVAAHAANASVVVVDYERISTDSAAGKSIQAQLKTILSNLNNELGPQQKSLEEEGKALSSLQGKSDAQVNAALNADKNLKGKFIAYQQHAANVESHQNLRAQEFDATRQKAMSDLAREAQPSVEEAMKARGADVAVSVAGTVAHAPGADVTNDVIARMDKRVTNIPVSLVDLTKQQGQ